MTRRAEHGVCAFETENMFAGAPACAFENGTLFAVAPACAFETGTFLAAALGQPSAKNRDYLSRV